MSNITEILNDIKDSNKIRHGKDMRKAIYDGIKTCYDDAIANGHTDMEVAQARKGYMTLNDRLSGQDNKISSLASGSPFVASSVDEMVDTNKVYVNTSDGHWYWYNGESWQDGGRYQAPEDSQVVNNLKANCDSLGFYKASVSYLVNPAGQTIVSGFPVIEGHAYQIKIKSNVNVNLVGGKLGLGSNGNKTITSEQLYNGYTQTIIAYASSENSRVYLLSTSGDEGAVITASIYDLTLAETCDSLPLKKDVDNNSSNIEYLINKLHVLGLFNTNDLEWGTLTNGLPDSYGASNKIRIRSNKFFKFQFPITLTNINNKYYIQVNYYDENLNFITAISYNNTIITIVPNIYFKFAIKKENNTEFTSLDDNLNVGFECDKTIIDLLNVEENVFDNSQVSLVQSAKKRYSTEEMGKNDTKQFLTIVHVTDVHGDSKRFKFAYDFADFIDADVVINTGDTVLYNSVDDTSFVNNIVNSHKTKYINVVGNHDVFGYQSASDVYNKHIEPFVNEQGWNIADSSNNTPYYYVDYDYYKIRVIVLDQYECYDFTMNIGYSQSQIIWLENTLNSIPENYGVIIAHHVPDSFINKSNDNPEFYQENVRNLEIGNGMLIDIIDAYISRTTYEFSQNTTGNISAYSLNLDFSNAKGEFIAYLNGHEHKDFIGYSSKSNNRQLILNSITTANWQKMKRPSGEDYPVYSEISDLPRVAGTNTENAFYVYVIDRENKTVKVVRIGSDITYNFKERKCTNISFSNN